MIELSGIGMVYYFSAISRNGGWRARSRKKENYLFPHLSLWPEVVNKRAVQVKVRKVGLRGELQGLQGLTWFPKMTVDQEACVTPIQTWFAKNDHVFESKSLRISQDKVSSQIGSSDGGLRRRGVEDGRALPRAPFYSVEKPGVLGASRDAFWAEQCCECMLLLTKLEKLELIWEHRSITTIYLCPVWI